MSKFPDSSINTLVLYARFSDRLSYYDDWLEAFQKSGLFRTESLNICGNGILTDLKKAMKDKDLIVLLHSTNADMIDFLKPIISLLIDRKSVLLSFVGNEVNLPGSSIGAKREFFKEIKPEFVASQLLLEAGEYLFGDLVQKSVIAIPHALNPEAFRNEIPQKNRKLDIGVRAVRYLPHLGDNDRNRTHDFFAHHKFDPDLKVNITAHRLDRKGWASFLNDCHGTVSSEAGSWYIERDDATVEAIRRWTTDQKKRGTFVISNDSRLTKLGYKLPWTIRAILRRLLTLGPIQHESIATEALPYEKIFDIFFREKSRPPVYGKCISSRHFDAIGTHTCQILLGGRYNDLLTPGEHYLSLKEDFSNIEEIMEKFLDPDHRKKIANAAYGHVMENHTYENRLKEIYDFLSS